jgi:mitotic spindle assembly checkpoint protein MAD1
LERRLSLQEQDIALVRTMRSEVARVQDLDKEVRRLREDNAYLR